MIRPLRVVAAGIIALILSFSLLRPAAEVCAVVIRRHWPEAWFSSSTVLYCEFLAAVLSLAAAVTVGRYTFKRSAGSKLTTRAG